MSPSWAGVAAGAIGLAVLDGVLSRSQATSNIGGWIAGAGKAVEWFLSPAVPAFSTTSTPASSPTTTTTTAAVETTPPASSASGAAPQQGEGFPGESLQTIQQGGTV